MPTTIDRVRTVLKRPNPTLQQLADAVADARRAEGDALADVDKIKATVAAGFMDPADKRAKDRASLQAAREAAEDASLMLAEAERRHAAALAADAEAARRVVYEAAKIQAEAAAADLAKLYPKLALDLVALLGRTAKAQQAVAAANADLPAGAAPLADPEIAVRGTPALPREVLSETEQVLWVNELERSPIRPAPEHLQPLITKAGDGWGIVPSLVEESLPPTRTPNFRRYRLMRSEVCDAVPSFSPVPLAGELQLPAIDGRGFLWERAPYGAPDAGEVLSRIDAIQAEAVAKPPKTIRPVKVEWTDLGEVEPLRLKPSQAHEGRSRFAAGHR